jgi:VanZ family protein
VLFVRRQPPSRHIVEMLELRQGSAEIAAHALAIGCVRYVAGRNDAICSAEEDYFAELWFSQSMTFSKALFFQKFMSFGAWSLLAFIAYATVAPIQARPSSSASSSVEHIAAFALLGFAFCTAYPRRLSFVCFVVLGSAALLEIFQLITPDRHGRIQDSIEKVAGGAAGILTAWIILLATNLWFQNRFGGKRKY